MKTIAKFSGRHEQILLNDDNSFEILFIIRGIQYKTHATLPSNIDPLDVKWYCRSIAKEYRQNKLKKILRKEEW